MDVVDGECLFSFELFVENIEHISVPCFIPAVAFRLLDYPTVITYFTSLVDIEKMRQKLGGYSQQDEVLIEMNNFKNLNNGYDFNKGKSCLFQHKFQSLNQLLKNVPLYLMLLDSWAEKPKLIGSCMIPLQDLMMQINQAFKQYGQNCPAVANHTGHYHVCNLMGTSIGKINVELKLTCFGQSLLRHVRLGGAKEQQINMLLNLDNSKSSKKEFPLAEEKELPSQKIDHVILPAVGKSSCANTSVSENKSVQCTQRIPKTNKTRRKISKKEETSQFEIIYNNIICPPPLCLNLHEPFLEKANIRLSKPKHKEKFILENDLTSYDSISSDEEPDAEILKPMPGRKSCYHVVKIKENVEPVPVSNELETEDKGKEEALNIIPSDLTKMPILCTLLKEITNLTNALTNNVHEKNISENPEKTENIKIKKGVLTKKTVDINNAKDKSPHLVSHARTDKQKRSATQKCSQRKLLSSAKRNSKQNKLTYGFTRTQRLRYKLTHKNETLPNNSIELHDQSELVELNLQSGGIPYGDNDKDTSQQPDSHNVVVHENENKGAQNGAFSCLQRPKPQAAKPLLLPWQHAHYAHFTNNVISFGICDIFSGSAPDQIKEETQTSPDRAISVLLPIPDLQQNSEDESLNSADVEDSFHNQVIPQKAGFYLPVEPRSISVSELGIFDDQSPWTSITKSRDQLSHDYDNESFHSDHSNSAITITSSVSLPDVSDSIENISPTHVTSSRNSRYSNPRHSTVPDKDRPISSRTNKGVTPSRISSAHSKGSDSRQSLRTNSTITRTDTAKSTAYVSEHSLTRNSSHANDSSRSTAYISERSLTRNSSYANESSMESVKERPDSKLSSRSSNNDDRDVRNNEPMKSAHSPLKSRNVRKKKGTTSDEKLLNESVRTLSSSK